MCIIPPPACHTNYDPNLLKSIYESQKRRVATMGKPNAPTIFVLFDDCGSLKCPVLNDLALFGRHDKIIVCILSQYIIQLPRETRGQVDAFVTRGDTNAAVLGVMCKEYFSFIGNQKTSEKIIHMLTKDNYQAAITDGEQLYVSTAEERGLFKVGSPEFRANILGHSISRNEHLSRKYALSQVSQEKAASSKAEVRVRDKSGKIVRKYELK
jgi:hypothetical protein